MKSILNKILIILTIFIISLFSCLLFLKESKAYSGAGILGNMQTDAGAAKDSYFNFNPQDVLGTIGQMGASMQAGLGADKKGGVCASPNNHNGDTSKWEIVSIMDVEKNGDVVVYTKRTTSKKNKI